MLNAKRAGDFAPPIGASVAVGLAKERGVRANVMLPYSDRLSRFAAWYVQLWGESLGKHGRGDDAGRGARPRRSAQPAPALSRRRAAAFHHHHPRELRRHRPACRARSRQGRRRRLPRRPHGGRSGRGAAARHPRGADRRRPAGPHHRPRAAGRARARRADDAFHAGNHPRGASSRRRPIRPAGGRIG